MPRLDGHLAHHRRLQAAEAEIETVFEAGARKIVCGSFAGLGGVFNRRATRKWQTQQPPHLVKGFARGVINRPAQPSIRAVIAHQNQFSMPARYDQGEHREFDFAVIRRQPERIDMPFQVIDAQQGIHTGGQRQTLGVS